jgi:hypothetical protein
MYFHYSISIEILTGCGYDTRTEILEEGFIEASNAEGARQQIALLGPQVLEQNWDRLADTLIGEMPTEDDLTVWVNPFDLDAECARTLRRIRAARDLRDEIPPDAFLEMDYEDRNGCGLE